jgi:hypothetical protein
MKNKNLYNLSFRADTSFVSGLSWRPILNSNFETNPNSNSNFEFFFKIKIDDLCN